VREGAKNYRSGLRIKSALDVENRNPTATRSRTFSEFVKASLGMEVRHGESVLWRTGRELDRHDMVARGELRKFREQGRDVLKGVFGMTK
jgi:hypothetical protein